MARISWSSARGAIEPVAQAGQPAAWRVVCDHDATTVETLCHIALFTQDQDNGAWLGVAVQILNGSHEIQVTSGGNAYRSAEIDVALDTTIITDYCYGSYCVFVHAENLVAQFKSAGGAKIRLYDDAPSAMIEKRVTLRGFTQAYEEYLDRIGN